MRRLLLTAALWTVGLLSANVVHGADAGPPPRYLILQRVNQGQATLVPAQAYAYGWFGAMPSSASTAHRSYCGTVFTWTYTPGR